MAKDKKKVKIRGSKKKKILIKIKGGSLRVIKVFLKHPLFLV